MHLQMSPHEIRYIYKAISPAAAAAFLNYRIPTGAGRFQMPGCVAIVAGQGIEWDSCSCSKSLGRTLVAA